MSDDAFAIVVIAGVIAVLALVERRRRIHKAKHRRTLSDMYQPLPNPRPSPPDKE